MANIIFRSFIIPVLLIAAPVLAQQNYDKVWIQGGGICYSTTFDAAGPVNQFWDTTSAPELYNSHSNICDAYGNLLLVTNGAKIFDADGNTFANGDTLLPPLIYQDWGSSVGPQNTIILPLGDSIYYVFVSTQTDSAFYYWEQGAEDSTATDDLLLYHVVDMKQNGFAGKVMKKKTPILSNTYISSGQMTACRHGNGKDWWLIKQGWGSNKVYKFLVKKDTVLGPYLQSFSDPVDFFSTASGQSAFSNNGTKYAVTCFNLTRSVFIADFDRCTGVLSNSKTYYTPYGDINTSTGTDASTVSLAFSPNDSFLYVGMRYSIQQLELDNPDSATAWVKIAGLDTSSAAFQGYSLMQLGHNNKIYVGNFNGQSAQMSAIDKPNLKGAACEFCPRCLRFPPFEITPTLIVGAVSQPPNMPNYKLGPMNPPCETEGVNEIPRQMEVRVYPNPADGSLTVACEKAGRFELSDMMGRPVGNWQLAENRAQNAGGRKQNGVVIDTRLLPAGLYVYRLVTKEGRAQSGKVIIEH